MSDRLKRRVYEIVECYTPAAGGRSVVDRFDVLIMALIVANVAAVMLETVDWIAAPYARLFRAFEVFSVAVFTAEYALRLWSCTADPRFAGAFRGRLRFALTPMAIIDVLAIMPFFLEFLAFDLRFVRVLRLFRLFRVFKLARYASSLRSLVDVLRSKKEELLVTLFTLVVLLIFASSAMYFAENEAQPEKFTSIPASMWWGVATLTTVGYGDIFPITSLGQLFGAVIAILGVGFFALPTGILASGFAEEIQKRRRRETVVCPHCGRDIHAPPDEMGGAAVEEVESG